jgi:choline dehydrogenase
MAGMIRPMSRGTIRLSGTSPQDELLIDPHTLECEADLRTLEEAVLLCREIGAAPALRAWGAGELYPGLGVAECADLRAWVRKTAITYHHQVGTCKMGIDADAVVDPELRVYGIEGLRVADASVMPTVPSGNTNAPSIMIGERVSDFFLRVHAPAAAEGAAVSA